VQLGLEEDEPTAGSPAPALERRPELFSQRRRRGRVRFGGPWEEVELAVDHLGDLVRRCR
jgi:hypothetical protein